MKNLKVAYLIISIFVALVLCGFIYLGKDQLGKAPYWLLIIIFIVLTLVFYGMFYYIKFKLPGTIVPRTRDMEAVKREIFEAFNKLQTLNKVLQIIYLSGIILNFFNSVGAYFFALAVSIKLIYSLRINSYIDLLSQEKPHPYGKLFIYDILLFLPLVMISIFAHNHVLNIIVNGIAIVFMFFINMLYTRKLEKIKKFYGYE
jgi:hypothetical protein